MAMLINLRIRICIFASFYAFNQEYMGLSFVYPSFLSALLLLSIPVFIHLFNLRRHRKIWFTNVRFLQQIQEQTKHQSKLKHLIVLACRILAISFLVLAFTQPYIKQSKAIQIASDRSISIFIDNSFSMESVATEGNLLQTAIVKAREIVAGCKESDRFHLLSNEFHSWQQRLLTKSEILDKLDEIQITAQSRNFSEVYSRQLSALQNSNSDQKLAFMISDFQKSKFDIESINYDSLIQYTVVPLQSVASNNIAIDTSYFIDPIVQINKPADFIVQLRNYGEADLEDVPITVKVNGVQKIVSSLSVPALSMAESKLTLTMQESGWQKIDVSITDNPITFDDHYYLSLHIPENIQVYAIQANGNSAQYINALFASRDFIDYKSVPIGQIDYTALQRSSFVVLNRLPQISSGLSLELNKFLQAGGSVCILLDSLAEVTSYNHMFVSWSIDPLMNRITVTERARTIHFNDPLFEGVFDRETNNMDLPLSRSYYNQQLNSTSNRNVLMEFQNGLPMLSSYACDKGKLYLWTAESIDESNNFIRHALFVPSMYRMALLSLKSNASSYVIGSDDAIKISNINLDAGEMVFRVSNKEKKTDFIPGYRNTTDGMVLFLHSQITEAGHYDVNSNNQTVAVVSMNYNPDESNPEVYQSEELEERFIGAGLVQLRLMDGTSNASLTRQVAQYSEGIQLWRWCVLLCLVFLALEIAALKWIRT